MKKLSTREKIMDAAINLFSESGYDKVSMRDIAALVGINVSSIYNHFPSKNSILEYILEDYTVHSSGVFYDHKAFSILQENPTTDGIMSCLQLSFPEGEEEHYLKVLYVIYQEQHRNPIIRQYVAESFLANEQYIKTVFDILKDLRIIRDDVDPDFWMKISSALFYTFGSRMMLGIGDNLPNYTGMNMGELLREMFDMMLKMCAVEYDRSTESDSPLDEER